MQARSIRQHILMTGMGWPSMQPGGLNTYFKQIGEQLAYEHEVHALICSPDKPVSAGTMHVVRVADPQMSPGQRRNAFRRHAAEIMDAMDIDVLFSHFALYGIGAAIEAKKRGIPVVMAFHGPWSEEMKAEGGGIKHRLKTVIAGAMEKKAYAIADAFIVLSETFRDILHERYDVPLEKIHLIPGAADIRRFQPAPDKLEAKRRHAVGDRTVLTVRRLVNRMGLLQLLDAWREVAREVPDATLLIGGKGPLQPELERRIAAYGLERRVRLLGYIPDGMLPGYYQAADIFVVPSQSLEGFGLISAEALASGLPVMATPVGGSREILQRFRPDMLFDGTGSEQIAAGIIRQLRQPERWPTPEQCREHALAHYTWERVAEQTEQVFAKVTAGKLNSSERTQASGQAKPAPRIEQSRQEGRA
ncbi:glycosyltransferase family 4 protein [Paenibacillus cymbidii]|uniref:glycosyltransferase family 4 protein n=1 Tax=Paenibacillus cymbidii TaxID=1639034 RepID=UPI001A9BA009|nr:glycosyltransferase family 4 protein [Paenibacillus cymbidii]